MAVQEPKKQDLAKLIDKKYDELFEKSESREDILRLLTDIISLSKKVNKNSDRYAIWILRPYFDEQGNYRNWDDIVKNDYIPDSEVEIEALSL